MADPTLDDVTVQDVTFYDAYYAVRAENTTGLLVQRTHYDTSGPNDVEGYYLTGTGSVGSSGTTVRANVLNKTCIWVTGTTGALIGGPTAADGNEITNAPCNAIWLGQQFAAGTSSSGTIQFNTINGAAEGGIVVWNYGTEATAGIHILDNVVEHSGNPGWDPNGGIAIYQASDTPIEIRRNEVTGSATAGLRLQQSSFTDAQITNNIFSDSGQADAVVASSTLGNVTFFNNTLGSMTISGGSGSVDASGNWWGDNGAASVKAAANGGTRVDFTPWLNSGDDTDGGVRGFAGDFSFLNVDDDSPQLGATGRIQEAVDMVSGSTVFVNAGTYDEVVTIDKSVTLLGAKYGQDARTRDTETGETIIDPGLTDGNLGTFRINADNVTIDGFEFANTTKAIHVTKSDGAANVTVRNNYVVDAAVDGINLWRATSGMVERNLVDGAGTSGITAGDDRGTPSTDDDIVTTATIQNNTVLNAAYGITGYLDNSQIAGNTVVGNDSGQAGVGGQFLNTTISGNNVSGYVNGAGWAFGPDLNRPVSAALCVADNTVSGNGIGVLLMQDAAGLFTEFSDNAINSSGLAAIAHAGTGTWDLTTAVGNTIDGIATDSANLADQFTLEDKILHQVDGSAFTVAPLSATGTVGLVRLVAGALFVTPDSYSAYMGSDSPSIQRAINVATAGDTVNVAAGSYSENLTIGKRLALVGAGSGDDPLVDTIVASATANDDVLRISAGGLDADNRLVVRGLRLTGALGSGNSGAGIEIGTPGAFYTFENVAAVGNEGHGFELNHTGVNSDVLVVGSTFSGNGGTGLRVPTGASIDGLTIRQSHFDENVYGMEAYMGYNSGSYLRNVLVEDTTFSGNSSKGIYVEKLDNATFDNITVDGSGTEGAWAAGIDINLKYGSYSNIVIENSTITRSGTGDAVNGVALAVKARDDGGYGGSKAATLASVTIRNNVVEDNQAGIRLGEPGKDNAGPTDVLITGNSISCNVVAGLNNQGQAVPDAAGNWWGSANGPTTPSNTYAYGSMATGDAVVGPVSVVAWLTDGTDQEPATPGFQPSGLDETPPVAPAVPHLTDASDTGDSHSDNITRNSTPDFTGTTEPGDDRDYGRHNQPRPNHGRRGWIVDHRQFAAGRRRTHHLRTRHRSGRQQQYVGCDDGVHRQHRPDRRRR